MKILHLISSPRGEDSYSVKLGNEIADRLKNKYNGSSVKVNNLTSVPYPHLEQFHVDAFAAGQDDQTAEKNRALQSSEQAIAELKEADIIIIGAPMYNFGIPSTLKTWLDHIVRAGITFGYTPDGPVGMVKGKKVYLAIASGGIYSHGPLKSYDFTEPYLRRVLNFIGIDDITTYRVEGVSLPDVQHSAYHAALEKLAV